MSETGKFDPIELRRLQNEVREQEENLRKLQIQVGRLKEQNERYFRYLLAAYHQRWPKLRIVDDERP